MKLFAFVDWHSDLSVWRKIEKKVKDENPDLIVCAGDISVFEQHIEGLMKMLDSLEKPIFIIHGNHELSGVLDKLSERSKNIKFIHRKIVEFQNFQFIGYGGGGFSVRDDGFERFANNIESKIKDKKVVLVTHAPFYGTNTDYVWKRHCGNKSFTEFIKNNKNVVLGICGHLHECAHTKDKIGNTLVINPGPEGEVINL
ncbi:MAG: metallophosphoesterase [Nanoarchaeota archaeon]